LAPGTFQPLRYSSCGSQTETEKPQKIAIVESYSASWPAPIGSMRYSGPKVLRNDCPSSLSA
jgi:hypothetical protein